MPAPNTGPAMSCRAMAGNLAQIGRCLVIRDRIHELRGGIAGPRCTCRCVPVYGAAHHVSRPRHAVELRAHHWHTAHAVRLVAALSAPWSHVFDSFAQRSAARQPLPPKTEPCAPLHRTLLYAGCTDSDISPRGPCIRSLSSRGPTTPVHRAGLQILKP